MIKKIKLTSLLLMCLLMVRLSCDEEETFGPPDPLNDDVDAVILTSNDRGLNWSAQYVNGVERFNSITISDSCIIAAGIGYQYHNLVGVITATTNNGTTWFFSSQVNGVEEFTSVFDLGNSHAIALGPETYVADAIRMSSNSGLHWDDAADVSGLNRLHFFNPNTGLAVGILGIIYRSSNGGYNWSQVTSPTTSDLYDVNFYTTIGYAVGSLGRVIKTTDGGETWTQLSNIPTQATLRGVAFAGNYTNVIAVGSNGTLIRTSNGGDNWIQIETGVTNQSLNDIAYYYAGAVLIVSGSGGTILRSTNLGLAWAIINTNTQRTLNEVYFDDKGKCYVAGE